MNWPYLRRAGLWTLEGGAVGLGVRIAASVSGLVPPLAVAVACAGAGGLGLLGFLGATTAEPSSGKGASSGPFADLESDSVAEGVQRNRTPDDGFAVTTALFWVSLRLAVAGVAGLV